MLLNGALPRSAVPVLARNGYARLGDLADAEYRQCVAAMEHIQGAFLARTRELWTPDFPIPGDALGHFTRQWEYPYAWCGLDRTAHTVLDAGSGITFFPYLLASAGHTVHACDDATDVTLAPRFGQANRLTGRRVEFTSASLVDLPYTAASFDAVVCLSVLEHVGPSFVAIVRGIARVLRPGGRLVLTVDVGLRRDTPLLVEDVGVLLAELETGFRPVFPSDLGRPADMLTSEACLDGMTWRLPPPWRPPVGATIGQEAVPDEFRSIAVLGMVWERL
jgi:SAM-dependent methyltransferase